MVRFDGMVWSEVRGQLSRTEWSTCTGQGSRMGAVGRDSAIGKDGKVGRDNTGQLDRNGRLAGTGQGS